ncbi:glycoside hydrolase family 13 protein [Allonocardiopsis opalescens]|uniref:glycoside hydrolase family 13 protein n=1 Tax=Allonocardiopsis opalescens TaxID=1144618 RepID=UPI001FEAF20C|nr:glycoside hydrolase family 13 protein [Allonocardiopsis opalescens]
MTDARPERRPAGPAEEGEGWWRHAVIYQVYVRSFADGNGDGIGDLAGIRARLPHLASLGVDAVWLTPFYTSPMADGGYDVADYRSVDPLFGDLAQFDALVADAHGAGLRIIVDIVPNHSSDEHTWFRQALAAPPGSPERARYLFRDGRGPDGSEPPNDWESVFGGPAWTRVTEADGRPGQWYLHLFDSKQPDFDWRNPEVRAEFADILRFWLDRGVDGFRIDVAHGLFKHPDLPDTGTKRSGMLDTSARPYWDQEEVHEVYREWRRILDSYPGQRIGVAEAWLPDTARLLRYLRPDELHQAFNFAFLTADWSAAAFLEVIDSTLATFDGHDSLPSWVLSNHDVTRHVTRYGGGEAGLRRARAAAMIMLALPGSAYVYQGEELGLEEVTDLPEDLLQDPTWERSGRTDRGRDGCRVPLPWAGHEPPYAFGPSAWLPAPPTWRAHTVDAQHGDADSVLNLYRTALRLRREFRHARRLRWLDAPDNVLDYATDSGLACTANMGTEPVEVIARGELLLASRPVERHGDRVVLAPDTAVWWRQ